MLRIVAFVVLLLLVVGSGIAVVHARQEHRQQFVALSALERERDELNIEFGRLQLEQATWAETNRIEQIARAELGMRYPGVGDLRVIQVGPAVDLLAPADGGER
jgi:cell division protein FtsL